MMPYKLAFVAAPNTAAQRAKQDLIQVYGQTPNAGADIVIALGGDGILLHTLRSALDYGLPVYGMNLGSVGFLMNPYDPLNLMDHLQSAQRITLHPLSMTAVDRDGITHSALAINEVSVLRQTHQAAKLRILVDDVVRLDELICDGTLLATPQGSTAYNLSARGPILPLGANLLALTPISPFRPRRWSGALLPSNTTVCIQVLEADKRPVSTSADSIEIRHIKQVTIAADPMRPLTVLFNKGFSLEERNIQEQFYSA